MVEVTEDEKTTKKQSTLSSMKAIKAYKRKQSL